mmetsp:Transcript_86130/g.208727  ORF Transcript_86130/g.208727 Transcript_86130/m.208727 type:complete len:197 (+) Transcript_86130:101-691(+)
MRCPPYGITPPPQPLEQGVAAGPRLWSAAQVVSRLLIIPGRSRAPVLPTKLRWHLLLQRHVRWSSSETQELSMPAKVPLPATHFPWLVEATLEDHASVEGEPGIRCRSGDVPLLILCAKENQLNASISCHEPRSRRRIQQKSPHQLRVSGIVLSFERCTRKWKHRATELASESPCTQSGLKIRRINTVQDFSSKLC